MARRRDTRPRLEVDTILLENQSRQTMKILRTLDVKIQKKVLRKGARAGGAVMLKALRAEAPKNNRFLSRSLAQKVKTYPSGNVVAVMGQHLGKRAAGIKATAAQQNKGLKGGGISGAGKVVPDHLATVAIRAHSVRPKRGRALKMVGRLRTEYSSGHSVPGTRGNRWHDRTFVRSKGPAQRATEAKLSTEVDAEVAKLPKVK